MLKRVNSFCSSFPKIMRIKICLFTLYRPQSRFSFNEFSTKALCRNSKEKPFDSHLDELMKAIIKVSSLIDITKSYEDSANSWILTATEDLYDVLFQWANERDCLTYVNNTLPVHLGLIKDEETKKTIKNSKLRGCLFAVNHLLKEQSFPDYTKDVLRILIETRTQA